MRAPGVDAEAALAPHPGEVVAVDDLEQQTEAFLQLAAPLLEHRGRGGDDDVLDLLAEQQLLGDQAGFDRLAEAGVVGDEQVDPGELERLAQGLHLVGVDLDPGAERRLEERRIRRRDAAPAHGVQEGGELVLAVETVGADLLPVLVLEDLPVELVVPVDLEELALGVLLGAGEGDAGGVARLFAGDDALDQPAAGADVDELAEFGDSAVERVGLTHRQPPGANQTHYNSWQLGSGCLSPTRGGRGHRQVAPDERPRRSFGDAVIAPPSTLDVPPVDNVKVLNLEDRGSPSWRLDASSRTAESEGLGLRRGRPTSANLERTAHGLGSPDPTWWRDARVLLSQRLTQLPWGRTLRSSARSGTARPEASAPRRQGSGGIDE